MSGSDFMKVAYKDGHNETFQYLQIPGISNYLCHSSLSIFIFKVSFVGHINMSYFGTTGTPVFLFMFLADNCPFVGPLAPCFEFLVMTPLGFLKPEQVLPHSHCRGECNVPCLRFSSCSAHCQPLDGQHYVVMI